MLKKLNINLNELNFEELGSWPIGVRAFVIVVFCVTLLGFGYIFAIQPQMRKWHTDQAKEDKLMQMLEIKQKAAAQLPGYKKQITQIQTRLANLLQQLPSKNEIPDLLKNMAKLGTANGVTIKLFKPLPVVALGFYVECPVEMIIIGNYHQLAQFMCEITGLDRMVILGDFTLERSKNVALPDELVLRIKVKTYYSNDY